MKQNKFKTVLSHFVGLFRIDEWFDDVFLWYVVILILTMFYNEKSAVPIAILFMAYHFFIVGLGYYVNSYADLEQDLIANKENVLVNISKAKRKRILLVLVIISAIFPLLFRSNFAFYLVAYLNLMLTIFYSLRPIRFKERKLGLIVASLTQGSIAYILFAMFANIPFIEYMWLLWWIFLIEMSDDLTHQIGDYLNDKKAKVKTLLTRIKLKKGIITNYVLLVLALIVPLAYAVQDFYKGLLFFIVLGIFTGEKFDNMILTIKNTRSEIEKLMKKKNI